MFFIYLLAVLTVFFLLFFCGPYHCGICKKVGYIKRYRLKINGKWPLVCSQCLAHSLSENRQPIRKINDNKTKLLKTKEGISVTAFVSRVSQPRGGYIKRNQLNKIELPDAYHFELENIHPSLVGIAVDYLTRYMLFGNKNKSFDISIKGSLNVGEVDKAMLLIEEIDTSLSDITIINACKLAGYDVAYRRGPHYLKILTA